jgi:hypothetical protein
MFDFMAEIDMFCIKEESLAFLSPSRYTITMVRNESNSRYVPCKKEQLREGEESR